MGITSCLVRLILLLLTAGAAIWLVGLNLRLYRPGRLEPAIAQLAFLADALDAGAADRMQGIFPEGYVFTWALYGLASAQVASSLPSSDPRREQALQAASRAVAAVDSDHGRATFDSHLRPRYGAFYVSWSLYLRSTTLRAFGRDRPPPFDLESFDRDCREFAGALASGETPFLPSYSGMTWPSDTAVGVAALALADSLFAYRYRSLISGWTGSVRRAFAASGSVIPHAVDTRTGMATVEPRGESLALLSRVLVDVDSSLSLAQYEALRERFVDHRFGIPGVRVHPRGTSGVGDVDSGPLVFGFGGPATVVGSAAAIVHGDVQVANALLASAEVVGFPVEVFGKRRYAAGRLPIGDAFLAWARTAPVPPAPPVEWDPVLPRGWRIPIQAALAMLLAVLLGLGARIIRGLGNPMVPGKSQHEP